MLSTVLANMRYRFILIGHHLHVQIQRQVLIVILLRFHRLYAGRAVLQRGQEAASACRLTPLSAICLLSAGRKRSAIS